MKKSYINIFFACVLFNTLPVFALEAPSVRLDLQPEAEMREPTRDDLSGVKQFEKFLVRYKHFHDMFPGEAINGDITAEVAKVYPYLDAAEVSAKAEDIQNAIRYYRYFEGLYEKAKERFLAPKAPPLIVEESEYDAPYEGEYIESDETVVIKDFKKVLSYGMNERDFEAVEARVMRRAQEKSKGIKGFARLGDMLSKLEFSKIFYYGLVYDDPFTGRDGLGEWLPEQPWGSVRLVSAEPEVYQQQLKTAVHFRLNRGYVLVVSPEKGYGEPQFDFSASENLDQAQVFMPLPQRIIDSSDANIIGYFNNFAVPVTVTVKELDKPLEYRARLNFTVCRENDCQRVDAKPELMLKSGENNVESAVSNFVRRSYNVLPQNELEDLHIKKAVVDEPYEKGGAPVLRVVLQSDEKPEKADIFIKSFNGVDFYRPRVTVNGDEIIARFESKDKNAVLAGEKYEITAAVNNMESLRTVVEARNASLFDVERQKLSFGLILLAVLGGFILNFMPCVFPVLSLKFLSLTKIGALREEHIRKAFAFTVAGIFLAFGLLILLLFVLKSVGIAIGWGMQFQNPYFIVAIMFVMVLFIAEIFGIIDIRTPDFVVRLLNRPQASDNFLNILTGLFLVLVATPCTAPYLGTVLGFALAGSYVDILVILPAVALGLAIPYILLAFYPELGLLMPKPGPWMQKLNKFMVSMLFLTVIWLASVLYAQTETSVIVWLLVCLLLFFAVLYFRRRIIDVVELQNETLETRRKAVKIVKGLALFLSILLISVSFFTAAEGYARHQAQIAVIRSVKLDKTEINRWLKEGRVVIVKVGADWCLTCKFNDITVFNNNNIAAVLDYYKVKMIEVDWTNYDKDVLEFMKKFGRSGLPFYIIFSRAVPDGMVLPEVLTDADLVSVIRGFSA